MLYFVFLMLDIQLPTENPGRMFFWCCSIMPEIMKDWKEKIHWQKNGRPHLALVEPYFGGSHRAFLEGLASHLCQWNFSWFTQPARGWKQRMQLAAPRMAERLLAAVDRGCHFDALLVSSFIDFTLLRSLLARHGLVLPTAIYFHENQFAYPVQQDSQSVYQFQALNFSSALAADSIVFNSEHNFLTFFTGVDRYLQRGASTGYRTDLLDDLHKKSRIIPPGMDYAEIDSIEAAAPGSEPVVLWNHRWEHDKQPDIFVDALEQLAGEGLAFRIIVLGDQHQRQTAALADARKRLGERVMHWGYATPRARYAELLRRGDIVVSTAVHEFFGMAVLEAVRAGCRPLVPDRLSYPELFPEQYRYQNSEFIPKLRRLLQRASRLDQGSSRNLTDPWSWSTLTPVYSSWLTALSSGNLLELNRVPPQKNNTVFAEESQ
ncbi:MAG: glycosyl transferase family 1 [Deltaproteobacteria bacterium]|nr:MAG: glycosyl transferase family 1 [Deltaproteobacteria bacterium]